MPFNSAVVIPERQKQVIDENIRLNLLEYGFREEALTFKFSDQLDKFSSIPDIVGHAGEFLKTDGIDIFWGSGGGGGGGFYQTIQENGTNLTQRDRLNFLSNFTVIDDGGLNNRTNVNLSDTGVTPGTYIAPTLIIDSKGRISSAVANSFVSTSRLINTSGGLQGGGDLSADRTLSLTDTGVTPGSYVNTNITVDAKGRITLIASGSGGLPAFSGTNGAVVKEINNPTPTAVFARLTLDEILPAFTINSFSPGFTTTKELGDSIVNPNFTASYNRPAAAASITDSIDTQLLTTPFTSFIYTRTYVKTAINATESWTLAANETGGPTKFAVVTAAWRPRVFFQEFVPPGLYDEAFIESLTGQALASGLSRTIAYGAGGGTKKLYYCFPTAFGSPTQFKDADTGFAVPFTKVATAVAVTNAFAVTVAGGYDIWESDNFLVAAVNVQVS